MYNELQLPGTFLHPVECVQVDLGDCELSFAIASVPAFIFHAIDINSATFDMHQNKLRDKIPLVLSLVSTASHYP